MQLKRTNYGAGRVVLSIFEFIAWIVLCIGVIATLTLVGTATRNFGGSGMMALIPGFFFCLGAIFIIVLVQIARSCVDSADYTYQMLGVARDNLAVSKQALTKWSAPQSFADRPPTAPTETSVRSSEPDIAPYAMAATPQAPLTKALTSRQEPYRGVTIQRSAEGYYVEGQVFETLELAKNFVDGEALRASLASST